MFALSVGILIGWGYFVWARIQNHEPWGTFGDSFAPITGLFTSFALLAAIISTILQSRELALQRQAMTDQKGEMEKQANAMEQLAAATYAQFGATMNQSFVNIQLAKLRLQDELRAVFSQADDKFSRKWKDPEDREKNLWRLIGKLAKNTETATRILRTDPEALALMHSVQNVQHVEDIVLKAARLTRQLDDLDTTGQRLVAFQNEVAAARKGNQAQSTESELVEQSDEIPESASAPTE